MQIQKSTGFFAEALDFDLQNGFGYTFYGRRDNLSLKNQTFHMGGVSGSCAQQNANSTKDKEYSDF